MRNEKLLPCPLCGHVAFNGGGVMGASCSNKHCALYDADIPFDQWNTRVSTTVNDKVWRTDKPKTLRRCTFILALMGRNKCTPYLLDTENNQTVEFLRINAFEKWCYLDDLINSKSGADISNCAKNAQSEISADITWEQLRDYCYDKFLISGNTTEFSFDYKSLFGHRICCRKDGCIEMQGAGYTLYLTHNRTPKQMYDIIKALVG